MVNMHDKNALTVQKQAPRYRRNIFPCGRDTLAQCLGHLQGGNT